MWSPHFLRSTSHVDIFLPGQAPLGGPPECGLFLPWEAGPHLPPGNLVFYWSSFSLFIPCHQGIRDQSLCETALPSTSTLPCHFPREQRSSMINLPRPSGILAFGCSSHYFWNNNNKKTSLYWGIEIYNAVIVSGEQWRDSATHIHVSILPQTPHLSPGCHITLNRVLCAIQ